MVKHGDQKQVGEERIYLTCVSTSQFILKGHQDRNSKQGRNLEAGADAEAMEECCLLACLLACSLCCPAEHRITSPEIVPPTMGWAFLQQLLIENVSQSEHVEAFSKSQLLLSAGSSLCQMNIKPTSTVA